MNKRIALILALLTLLSCVMPVLAEETPAAVSAEEAPAAEMPKEEGEKKD